MRGDFLFEKEEIDEIRFWSFDEIQQAIGNQLLSDVFRAGVHDVSRRNYLRGNAL
jgi:hypothetical protein